MALLNAPLLSLDDDAVKFSDTTPTDEDASSDISYEYDDNLEKMPLSQPQSTRTRCIYMIVNPLLFIWRMLSYLLVIFPRSLKPASTKIHPTSYLDALRGYAAWVVYNSHVIHEDWRPGSSFIMKFPFFKLMFSGHSMVDIFFVISGYALSYRMLNHMHAKQTNKVMDSLASSIFRRYMRLYLPTAAATFVAMIAIATGLAIKGEDPPVYQPSFFGNFRYWIADTLRASNPFPHVAGWWYGGLLGTDYLPQMWTIPVEFRGSLILFMFCAATCKMTPKTRMSFTWLCIVMFFWWEAQYAALFLTGLWIADMRLWNARQQGDQISSPGLGLLPLNSTPRMTNEGGNVEGQDRTSISGFRTISTPTLVQQIPYIILFTFSFTPLTAPLLIDTNSPFPFNFFAVFIPPRYNQGAQIHFPLAIGAMLMVYTLENSPLLQKPLMTSFSQFVGELSFGLYAMHNTIRWIVWEKYLVKWQFAFWGPDAKEPWNFLPGYLIMTVLVVWAAEGFRRVDMAVVRWGKILEGWCFES